MKRISSAITLVELIIATLIVSMVIAGVFSADYALRRTNENASGDAQTSIQTKSLAEAVRAAVKTAHGELMTPNHPISINIAGRTLCFRQDIVVGTMFTPSIYSDDNWTCFTQVGTNVYRCNTGTAPGTCTSAGLLVGALVADQFTNGTVLALGPTYVSNAATGECVFGMTFVGRRDPSANAAITAGALTMGTDANPQTVVRVWENCGGF